MRWRCLAADFDETLSTGGILYEPARQALLRLRAENIRTLLVTGRELADFRTLGTPLEIFDLVVAENGAVLYEPATEDLHLLGPEPPEEFITELQRRGVTSLSIGSCILATREPHEVAVLETIKELGLEYHLIFNKGAVMILPSGINKGSGLLAALKQLNIAAEDAVGIGDAENDHVFLETCGLPAAVANALPSLKAKAAWVADSPAGAGVTQLIDSLLRGELDGMAQTQKPL